MVVFLCMRNAYSSFIVDVAVGQIRRSTENISTPCPEKRYHLIFCRNFAES